MTQCTICCSTRPRLLSRKGGAAYHFCAECRVVFPHPLPPPDEMLSYADNQYEEGLYRDYVEAREMKLEHFRHRLEQLLSRGHRGRLLDIGCSCGYFMQVAAENGFEVEGLEFSRAAIAAADPSVRSRISCSSVDTFDSDRSTATRRSPNT
jgi:protein-L-isoaspartate O-methyltransferase